MNILITGVAGYIGSNFCKRIAEKNKNYKIITFDNINDYYPKKIKYLRLKELKKIKNVKFFKLDLINKTAIDNLFKKYSFDEVFHFAAQAGVRYSVINPQAYVNSNIKGFLNIIDACKKYKVKKLFFSSSSSVYGDSKKFPFKENQVLKPKSFYAMSKKFNEDTAKLYFENYKLKSIGLRFFTVIGETGRPDMLINKYLDGAFNKKKFFLNNYGKGVRDFTYVGDVVNMLLKLRKKKFQKYEVFNICSNKPISLKNILNILKKNSPKFNIIKRGFQRSDVFKTHGQNAKINKAVKFKEYKDANFALLSTIEWYKKNHKLLR